MEINNLRSFFEQAIAQGQFWPLTPKKNLYLVHAVPKPLVASPKDPKEKPVFKFSQALTVEPRVTGGIATVLHDAELRVHRASTGRIDVYAEWDEHSDGPGLPVFPRKERRQHICFSSDIDLPDLTIAPDESHLTVDFAKRHEFPTTKHYAVRYHMVATTRYREYYDPQFTADSANITITSEKSDVFHILNTTPPPALEVVYVLPILIWEDPAIAQPSGSWESLVVERKVRRGLRVYMRRNWFLSGEDERLGVVFAQKASSTAIAIDADPEHQVAVTQWGTNPIWLTKALDRQPTVDDAAVDAQMRFSGIKIAKKGTMAAMAAQRDVPSSMAADDELNANSPLLKLRRADDQVELPPGEIETVNVAAFPVYCDFDKDLDYADVEFGETASYSPMVKLALARFQPHSAAYAHLSPITHWVFQSVSPERVLAYGIVTEMNEDPLRPTKQLRFTIAGIAPGDSRLGYRENSLEVLLFDGETPVSESQIPLSVPDKTHGFRIPMSFLESLKRPTVQIKEFEHVGGDTPRLAFVYTAAIDVDAIDQI
ncbi:hypothetical protein [Mesorhizobium sp. CN2-181]|uniref:hypothetical protein n=1 Tax=Mesorhizobium yinganensis TaxID=3157707 RepID=UPI0032B7D670